jgi:hypothetical protein
MNQRRIKYYTTVEVDSDDGLYLTLPNREVIKYAMNKLLHQLTI